MKKNAKKLLSVVFAVVMTAFTVVLAFAAEPKEDAASPNALTSMTFDSGKEYTLGEGMGLPANKRSAYVTSMTFYRGLNTVDFSNYIDWTADGPNWYGIPCGVWLTMVASYKRSDHYAGDSLRKTLSKSFTFPRVGSIYVPFNILEGSIDLTEVFYSGSTFDGWQNFGLTAYFYYGCSEDEALPPSDWTDFSMLSVPYSAVQSLDD